MGKQKKKKKKKQSVEPRSDEDLIQFYKKDRRFITVPSESKSQSSDEQKSDSKASDDENDNELIVRVMTYNILADGIRYALADRHNYCPIQYRKWSYRFQSILCQLKAYQPDIVCIQETTPSTWKKKIQQPLKDIGYNGIHAARDLFDARVSGKTQSDAFIWKESKYTLIKHKILRFSDFVSKPDKNKDKKENKESYDTNYDKLLGSNKSMYRSFCSSCSDVAIVLHLKCNKTNKAFVAVSSHFYWDPRKPEVKATQALVMNIELERLLINDWNLSEDINATPIVFGVDSNSLPFKGEKDEYDPDLPDGGARSGVYELYVDGKLSKTHKDHPYTRVNKREERYKEAHKGQSGSIKMSEKEIEYVGDGMDWEINIKWKSVYSFVNKRNELKEPIFTNRVPMFTDTLDYIFVNDKCEIKTFLEMPWQKELKYHILMDDNNTDENENKNGKDTKWIEKELKNEIKLCQKFPYLPNKDHPSDHLPLCADILIKV